MPARLSFSKSFPPFLSCLSVFCLTFCLVVFILSDSLSPLLSLSLLIIIIIIIIFYLFFQNPLLTFQTRGGDFPPRAPARFVWKETRRKEEGKGKGPTGLSCPALPCPALLPFFFQYFLLINLNPPHQQPPPHQPTINSLLFFSFGRGGEKKEESIIDRFGRYGR